MENIHVIIYEFIIVLLLLLLINSIYNLLFIHNILLLCIIF